MTLEDLMICTGAKKEHAERFLKPIEEAMDLYGIDTPQRQAGFLSQIGHESGGLSILTENLNYRVEALMSMFGRHRISEADCKKYGRTKDQPADQERIANLIYGGDWGVKNLGNTEPGDGWKYRGRGLKQLTGRDNYKRCGQALGVTLVDDPEVARKLLIRFPLSSRVSNAMMPARVVPVLSIARNLALAPLPLPTPSR